MLNVSSASLDQVLARGRHAEKAGRLDEAQRAYEEVLRLTPGHLEAMHLLGVFLFRRGAPDRAAELFRNVVAGAPNSADAWNSLGLALHSLRKAPEAENAFRTATRLNPHNAIFWSNLSLPLKAQGRPGEAVHACRAALRLAPSLADAHNNLGNALRATGRLDDAIHSFREAVKQDPAHAEAWSNLGTSLGDAGQGTEALQAFDEAIRLKPATAELHANRALQLQAMKRTDEAIAECREAIALSPAVPSAHLTLAALLVARGQKEEASQILQEAIARFPDADELRFDLERLSGDTQLRKLPPEMIRALFDHYAPLFESHLLHQLAYRGPELLMQAVRAVDPTLEKRDILDLGCGTGLCGLLFKPLANRLVGIDLAEAMLARAVAHNIYDELLQGDLAPLMNARPDAFDLLLAGDVFEYLGELDDVFAAARTALRPNGLFAFTVEKSADAPLLLQESRRFAHSLDYVRTLAQRHAFAILHIQEEILRLEHQNPLPAWVAVLRKTP